MKLNGLNTYFTSDLHFNQTNIVEKLTKWEDADCLRDFDSTQHMDNVIVDNINKTVGEHDNLIILGDLYFGKDPDYIKELLYDIQCKYVYLVFGNHDYEIRKNKELRKRFVRCSNYLELSLRYPHEGIDPHRDKWKGHQFCVCSHYSMRVWNKSHRGAWMLYGHSHGGLDVHGTKYHPVNRFYNEHKTMDVGIDAAKKWLHEYRPFSFLELKNIMDTRKVLCLDHHKPDTK